MRVIFGGSLNKGKRLKKIGTRYSTRGGSPASMPVVRAYGDESYTFIPFDVASRLAMARIRGATLALPVNDKRALPVIRYLAYLLIVTVIVTGVSLSRYSGSSLTNETARTAKFDVSVSSDGSQWSDPGNRTDNVIVGNDMRKTYTFDIDNLSEVAIRGKIDVSGNSQDFPITMRVGEVSAPEISLPSSDYDIILDPGVGTTVYVRIYASAATDGTADPDFDDDNFNNIEFFFTFEQID